MQRTGPLHVSFFPSMYDHPQAHAMPWVQLADLLSSPQESPRGRAKLQAPAWSPAAFRPGAPRASANAIAVECLVLDIDGKSAAPDILDRLIADGLDFAAHTTWSHREGYPSLRVILPLARPIPAAAWPRWYSSALAALQVREDSDPQCKDAARLYFGPMYPYGGEGYGYHHRTGKWLDLPIPEISARAPVDRVPVSMQALERLAKAWRGKHHILADALTSLTKGEPYAEKGFRDSITFRLCCELAKVFPDADPASLAEHFRASLSHMGADAPDPLAKLERALAREESTEADPLPAKALTEMHGDLARRWIVQKDRAFWLLAEDGYRGPYSDRDVLGAAPRDLAHAAVYGLNLYSMDKDGRPARKPIQSLIDEYGSVATSLRATFLKPYSWYDTETRTLWEVPTPRRTAIPTYHPKVAEWLAKLAADRLPAMLDWIAALGALDRPCAAIFLVGDPGAGKSLFAYACGALWGRDPAPLEHAMSSFNADAYLSSPILFGDETIPKDWKGRHRTEEIRQMVQATSRSIRRKFVSDTTLEGAARIIIAANDEKILTLDGDLSESDIRAIAERILHIPVGPSAAGFIAEAQAMGHLPAERADLLESVVRHFEWLIANHKPNWHGRFLVTHPSDRDLFLRLSTREPLRSSVLRWIMGYLANPAPLDRSGRALVRVVRDRHSDAPVMLITTQAVEEYWGIYVPNERPPRVALIANALSGVTKFRRSSLKHPKTRQEIKYRHVDTELLIAWAESLEYGTREDILTRLGELAELGPEKPAFAPAPQWH